MRKLLLSSIMFLFSGTVISTAQVYSYSELDINNVRARFFANGGLFRDSGNPIPSSGFEVPIGSGNSTIYTSRLWIGGIDNNGQLKFAGERYNQIGRDFFAGPLTTDGSASCDNTVDSLYNRVWKIDRTTIDSFITGLFTSVPNSISEWPAHGDVSLGQSYHLAPFVDLNSNGNYEPENGDYPKMRGDQALFFIFNDKCGIHTESGGNAIGLEIHGMAYAFNCPQDSALANTIFVHYDIINRGSFTLSNTYVGLWSDMDIGFANDDYMQCDVMRGSFFTYNGVNTNYSPSQSVTFLAGPYQDVNGIDDTVGIGVYESLNGFGFGDGIIDNERIGLSRFLYHNNNDPGPTGDPELAVHYYDLLRGIWKDGTSVVYGGNGHISGGGTMPAWYMFPADSDQEYYWGTNATPVPPWTEQGSNNTPNDRRGLGSSGPFTLEPGEVNPFDIAFVFGRDFTGSSLESITVMKERIDAIRAMFLADSTTCGGSISSVQQIASIQNKIVVYPNPAKDIITVSCSVPAKEQVFELYNISGQKVIVESISTISDKTEIDLSALTSGIYLLRIFAQNEIVHVQKIIKN